MSPWQEITINGQLWTLGRSLGSGGFGEVYAAESRGQWAAIKLVPKDPGARRELLIADDLRGTKNVMPVLGVGETATHWALLMPMAEQTLRQHLSEAGGPLNEAEALPILIDLAQALTSLAATGVIHRDLKPENVLLYQGSWCLTDFGISRYADATTAKDTRKYSSTRPYAAPEQWRDETATAATDVYALGVVSHELVTGSRPFPGPEFRHQHLHEDPPVITGIAPSLAALVEECLFKPSGARPSVQNLLSRLERQAGAGPMSRGLAALQDANLAAASQLARQARHQSESQSERERREALLHVARRQFDTISIELKQAILSAAPASTLMHIDIPAWQISLGDAQIRFSSMFAASIEEANLLRRRVAVAYTFDIIASGELAVSTPDDLSSDINRRNLLLFCDGQEPGRYGWHEVALDVKDSGQLTLLEVGELDEFIDRWASWLAGSPHDLSHESSRNPLQAKAPRRGLSGTWRRLVDSVKKAPSSPQDADEASAREEDDEVGEFFRYLDANPDWDQPRRPRSVERASELLRGTDSQSLEHTSWMNPLVEILQSELAQRGESEVLRTARAFQHEIAEALGRQPKPKEPSNNLQQALQILAAAKYAFDRRNSPPLFHDRESYDLMIELSSLGKAAAGSVTRDPFETGEVGQKTRRRLAMSFVKLSGHYASVPKVIGDEA